MFALLSNCIVAPIFFNERMTRTGALGVLVAVAGILLVIFSLQNEMDLPDADPEELIIGAVKQESFRIYVAVSCTAVTLLAAYSRFHSTAIDARSRQMLVVNISLVALLGAYTVLATKCLSLLLSREFAIALGKPVTYIAGLVLAVTAVLQVAYLNRALKHFASTAVVPMHFAFFSVSVIVASAITFHDFDAFDALHMAMFVAGCATIFTGVWLTSMKTEFSNYVYGDDEDSSSESADEQAFEATQASPLLRVSHRRHTSADDASSDPSQSYGVSVPGLGFGSVWRSRQSLRPVRSADDESDYRPRSLEP